MIWVPRGATTAVAYLVAILAETCKLSPVDDGMLMMVISTIAEICLLIEWASPLCTDLPDEMQAVGN